MEAAWKLGNTYLMIQDCESGWDFTILDLLFSEIDGGVVESMNFTLEEVRDDIMADYNLCSLICEEVEYDKLMEQIEANRKV